MPAAFLRIRCDNSRYGRLGPRFSCKTRPPQEGATPAGESDSQGMRPAAAAPTPAPAARDPWNVQPPPRRPAAGAVSLRWLGTVVAMLLVGLMAGFFIGRSQYSGDAAALAEANVRVGELEFAALPIRGSQLDLLPRHRGPQGRTQQARLDVDDGAGAERRPGQLLRRRLPRRRRHPRGDVRRRGQRQHRLLGPAQRHRRRHLLHHRERHPEGAVRPHHRSRRQGGRAARGHSDARSAPVPARLPRRARSPAACAVLRLPTGRSPRSARRTWRPGRRASP